MEDNIVYAVFLGLPLVTAALVYLYFVRCGQHRRTTRRWLRLVVGNLLVLMFLLSVCLLGGETYFRFFYDTTDSFGLTKTHQRWLARHFDTCKNNMGMRDNVEYAMQIPPNKRRISFLGDSFTAGHGVKDVKERFVNLVRRRHPEWDIHALARNGMNTGEELEMLMKLGGMKPPTSDTSLNIDASGRIVLGADAQGRRLLGRDRLGRVVLRDLADNLTSEPDTQEWFTRKYQFDVVVLVYCLNDIADYVPEWPAVLNRIQQTSKPGWLGTHSFLFNTLHYRLYAAQDPDLAKFFQFTRSAFEPAGKAWPAHREELIVLQSLVRTWGGKLLVVTFPYLDQLATNSPLRSVHEQLGQFWRERGVPHLDLLPIYERHRAEHLVVNRFDAHPNERAHQIAADAMDVFLKENLDRQDVK